MRRAIWLWGPPALLAGAIFYLSSRAIPAAVAPVQGVDKLAHLGVYALLGALLARALLGAKVRYAVLWASLIGTAYGATDELHQSFVPARSAELLDLVADAAGSVLGSLGYYACHRWLSRRRSTD